MPELLAWTLLLGIATVGLTVLLARTLVTPAILYWGGWVAGVGAAESMSGDGVFPAFSDAGRELVLRAHVGAAIGFIAGALLFRLVCEAQGQRPQQQGAGTTRLELSPRLVHWLLAAQVLIGAYYLQTMLADIVAEGGIAHLVSIRALYLQRAHMVTEMAPVTRFVSHFGLLLLVFPFLFATQDALDGGFRWKRLLLWWAAGVPAGLATGGRSWIVNVPLIYAISYVVTTGAWLSPAVRRLVLRGALAVVVMVVLFGAIDRLRSDNYERDSVIAQMSEDGRWYDRFKPIKPVVFYAGFPTLAIAAFTDFAQSTDRYGGALTLPFPAAQLERLGLVRSSALDFLRRSRAAVQRGPEPLLAYTHATIIPLLVGDFGLPLLTFGMMCFALVVQFGFLLLRDRGIMARFIAVHLALYGGFWMFQDSMLGTAGVWLPALWLGGIILLDRVAAGSGGRPLVRLSTEAQPATSRSASAVLPLPAVQ
jgi:hypothetical protein